MTTTYDLTVECSICKTKQNLCKIGSTNEFGSCDLDLRPAQMKRSTIGWWIHRCKKCGYCAVDLQDYDENIKPIICSVKYQNQLSDKRFSDLANSFLCASMIAESVNEYFGAAWDSIHAAWVCDDRKNQAGSIFCRKRALNLFDMEDALADSKTKMTLEYNLLKVDLLRRANMFNEALAIIQENLSKISDTQLQNILLFQNKLCSIKDVGCYTVADVS